MELDDLPRSPRQEPPKELSTLSEAELHAYIASLEAEIARARQALDAKKTQWSAAEGLFKKG